VKQALRIFPAHPLFGITILALILLSGVFAIKTSPLTSAGFPRLGGAAAEAILPPALSPEVTSASTTQPQNLPMLYDYAEIINSCGPYYNGDVCVNLRSGPGTHYPSVMKLRNGMVLKVAETVTDSTGQEWYRIEQDKTVRFPERIESDWYVSAQYAQLMYIDGDHWLGRGEVATTTKHIVVDLSDEMVYAYNGDGSLFMKQAISTGLDATPTPPGDFVVFHKTPSRYMQGPIPGVSDQVYDLPGVPWNLYFTKDGAAIHGAYWHDHFGRQWSHGCVNLPLDQAEKLYFWADVGTIVKIQE
jgi:lipoprotein-anchoring transpeptidase ErfK/SrfK